MLQRWQARLRVPSLQWCPRGITGRVDDLHLGSAILYRLCLRIRRLWLNLLIIRINQRIVSVLIRIDLLRLPLSDFTIVVLWVLLPRVEIWLLLGLLGCLADAVPRFDVVVVLLFKTNNDLLLLQAFGGGVTG